MNKDQLIAQIQEGLASGVITTDDIGSLVAKRGGAPLSQRHIKITEILYALGAGIVILGIVSLLYQSWDQLSSTARIASTLGASIAAFVSGALLQYGQKKTPISTAFFLIAGVVAPIGIGVAMKESGIDPGSLSSQTFISGLLTAIFIVLMINYRHILFAIFSIIAGSWLFLVGTELLVNGQPIGIESGDFVSYRILVLGISYLALATATKGSFRKLRGVLNSFGTLLILGSTLALGGWSPEQNVFWEIIYPGIAISFAFWSVKSHSTAQLVWSSLFLMGYIIKITAEYFSDSLGWPLALVIAGLSLIGTGYGTFYLNKKYVETPLK